MEGKYERLDATVQRKSERQHQLEQDHKVCFGGRGARRLLCSLDINFRSHRK